MAKYPLAIQKPIAHGSEDPGITPIGLVYHVRDGLGDSLFADFSDGRGIESHFYIRFTGEVEQYRDTSVQADANLDGNGFIGPGGVFQGLLSVETEGLGAGRWTDEQLASLKALSRWVHFRHDIPLKVCEDWNKPGFGWHIMFGSPGPWTDDVKTCPGPDRVKQFKEIIIPWLAAGAPEEDPDMQLTDPIGNNTDVTVGQVLRRMDTYLTRTVPAMREQIKNVRLEVENVPEGASPAEIKQIVTRALEGLDATIQLVVDRQDPVRVTRVDDDDDDI